MRLLGILVLLGMVTFTLFISNVSAGIGFGMTDLQSEKVMGSDQNVVCATYYLYNPGDIDIEGYLDVDRDSGEELNKLLGLYPLYDELDIFDERAAALQEEFNAIPEGESTFEVEQKQADLSAEVAPLLKRIEDKKPKQRIHIPAHTEAYAEDGSYQMPIDICFTRPTKRYLFSTVGDTDFCGVYEGEIVGRYTPRATEAQGGSGSAIIGSRSTRLTIRVLCNLDEIKNAKTKATVTIAAIVIIILTLSIWIWKKIKSGNKKPKQQKTTTPKVDGDYLDFDQM